MRPFNVGSTDCIVVVGANGSIGRLILDSCIIFGVPSIGIDLNSGECEHCIPGDLLNPSTRLIEHLEKATIVVLAVSAKICVEAFTVLESIVSDRTLLVETCSIKSPILQAITSNPRLLQQPIWGINPMFAGDLNPTGRSVLTVSYNHDWDYLTRPLESVLRNRGMNLIPMDPIGHDEELALYQGLPHLVTIMFSTVLGRILKNKQPHGEWAPFPFKTLLALADRISMNIPDVYSEIQLDNPYCKQIQENVLNTLEEICSDAIMGSKGALENHIEAMNENLREGRNQRLNVLQGLIGISESHYSQKVT